VLLQTFSDETCHPETASTNMTYAGSFQQERESTAIEFDFFLFCNEAYSFVDLFSKLL
jgi:hypothetical protein